MIATATAARKPSFELSFDITPSCPRVKKRHTMIAHHNAGHGVWFQSLVSRQIHGIDMGIDML